MKKESIFLLFILISTNVFAQGKLQTQAIFYFSSDCFACEPQSKILRQFEHLTNTKVKAISLDGLPLHNGLYSNYIKDNGDSKLLQVRVTPTILLKNNINDDYIMVSEGLIGLNSLDMRIKSYVKKARWKQ